MCTLHLVTELGDRVVVASRTTDFPTLPDELIMVVRLQRDLGADTGDRRQVKVVDDLVSWRGPKGGGWIV